MDSRQLLSFRRIIEHGSISAAARSLGVAQPSLSQMIQGLEAELGVALLVRSRRGVVPTEAGKILAGHAAKVLTQLRTAEEEVRAAGAAPAGRVTIGLPPSVSMSLSAALAETVHVAAPSISLIPVEAMSGHIKRWIEDQALDIGFVYDLDGMEAHRARPVLSERLWLVAAPDAWPVATPPGAPVPLAALAGVELILPSPGHGLRRLVEAVCAAIGITPKVVMQMDSLHQIKTLTARGSGASIHSPAGVHDMIASGQLAWAPIVEPAIRRPVHMVRNGRVAASAASLMVERLCLEAIRDLVGRGIWEADLFPDPGP